MGQRLLDLLGTLQTLATVASIWIEIVALQPKTDLAANCVRLWHDGPAMRIQETAQILTRKILTVITRQQTRGAACGWSRVGKVSRGGVIDLPRLGPPDTCLVGDRFRPTHL